MTQAKNDQSNALGPFVLEAKRMRNSTNFTRYEQQRTKKGRLQVLVPVELVQRPDAVSVTISLDTSQPGIVLEKCGDGEAARYRPVDAGKLGDVFIPYDIFPNNAPERLSIRLDWTR